LGAALQADGEYEVRVYGLKHQKEKRSMDHFAGLDVSVKETSVCIVDDTGKIVREVKVASEPNALLAVLKNPAYHFKRIGLEAGPLSQWLCSALADAELPVVCVETRHMQFCAMPRASLRSVLLICAGRRTARKLMFQGFPMPNSYSS
jgi:transposase